MKKEVVYKVECPRCREVRELTKKPAKRCDSPYGYHCSHCKRMI